MARKLVGDIDKYKPANWQELVKEGSTTTIVEGPVNMRLSLRRKGGY
jgi:hypothetical protein